MQTAVRLALVVLILASLVLAAEMPHAFDTGGWLIAVVYVLTQVGRGAFIIWALRGEQLQKTFWRVTAWSVLAAVPMLAGAAVPGHGRELLWAAAVAIELVGAAIGFQTPGLGRSHTSDWTIDGRHFAERCQAFVLIAIGESIIVIGGRLYDLAEPSGRQIATFVVAFLGNVALWWVSFDRAAADSARVIGESEDSGRLGRNAFHWIHPLIVGGIIVSAAADDVVLTHPGELGSMATAWLVLGGTVLYLAGHAAFKATVWG